MGRHPVFITAEVKCLNCSRICGEVERVRVNRISFADIRPYGASRACLTREERRIRCDRCVGAVYLDDVRLVKPPGPRQRDPLATGAFLRSAPGTPRTNRNPDVTEWISRASA